MKLLLILVLVGCTIKNIVCQRENRIVGGSLARPNELPFMVSLQVFGIPFCSGTLITSRYILTAADCGSVLSNIPRTAVVGSNSFNIYSPRPSTTQQSRTIIEFVNHSDFTTGPNNVAMAKVEFSFILNRNVLPIQLPPAKLSETPGLSKTFIAGWGSTSPTNYAYSMNLMKAALPIMSRTTCEVAWSSEEFSETDICAGNLLGATSGCYGDLGAPLFMEYGQGEFGLLGVFRFITTPCVEAGKPAIFVDVSNEKILDFIKTTVNPPNPTTEPPPTVTEEI